jgi:hypothetical protein
MIDRIVSPHGFEVQIRAPRRLLCCQNAHPPFNKEHLLKELEERNICMPVTAMVLRKTFLEVGGFDPGLLCGEDHVLWRRILDRDDSIVEFLDEPTCYYTTFTDKRNQNFQLKMPDAGGGRHLDLKHPAGGGRYLDGEAKARAQAWLAHQ